MITSGSYKLRFYEKDPTVKFAVELLLAYPSNIQVPIAKGFSHIAEKDYNARDLLNGVKSLGSQKVIALHQSKLKRRSYDQEPTMHQAMTYLMVLPPENQKGIATRLVELIELVQVYLTLSHTHVFPPKPEVLERISDTYARQGHSSAQGLLNAIQTECNQKKKNEDGEAIQSLDTGKSRPYGETIKYETTGMKVKKDFL